MGCDCKELAARRDAIISIHAPTWGATVNVSRVKLLICISIHAPTWGATRPLPRLLLFYFISIHAPTWGATCILICPISILSYFNPRTHVGCDQGLSTMTDARVYFNPRTHVGCDVILCQHRFVFLFQSTHPRGVRRRLPLLLVLAVLFQSTHPRGVRRSHVHRTTAAFHFNPRTHVGCDCITAYLFDLAEISIHAPTWGATYDDWYRDGRIQFQSTHPRGVRPPLS